MKKKEKGWNYKIYLVGVVVTAVLSALCGIWEASGAHETVSINQLERGNSGAGDSEVILSLHDGKQAYEYAVTVQEQIFTEAGLEQVLQKAAQETEHIILGENPSLEAVSEPLYLPQQLQQRTVEVSWYFEPYDVIDVDGSILWENFTESEDLVKVTAEMTCQEKGMSHEFYLRLTPKELSEQEKLFQAIEENLARENQKAGEQYLQLPQKIGDTRLTWSEPGIAMWQSVLLLGLVAMISYYVYTKQKKEQEEQERAQLLKRDYPDIVSQLSLLTGAGMTVTAAWGKLATEYAEQRREKRIPFKPGFEEMSKTWHEMQDGIGEIKAYENFGIRCEQPQYRKLSSILMQNVRKGTKGMQQLLDVEVMEAFLQRKAHARRLGEEAGTKMLLPMGIMLVLVFAILILPAMLQLQL